MIGGQREQPVKNEDHWDSARDDEPSRRGGAGQPGRGP